jgi:hypothetical protein
MSPSAQSVDCRHVPPALDEFAAELHATGSIDPAASPADTPSAAHPRRQPSTVATPAMVSPIPRPRSAGARRRPSISPSPPAVPRGCATSLGRETRCESRTGARHSRARASERQGASEGERGRGAREPYDCEQTARPQRGKAEVRAPPAARLCRLRTGSQIGSVTSRERTLANVGVRPRRSASPQPSRARN